MKNLIHLIYLLKFKENNLSSEEISSISVQLRLKSAKNFQVSSLSNGFIKVYKTTINEGSIRLIPFQKKIVLMTNGTICSPISLVKGIEFDWENLK